MSAAIKPEIYASIKLTKGFLGIAPEIYATLEMTGKIVFKPLVYATILPQPQFVQIGADTCRTIKTDENTGGDTKRQLAIFESVRCDTNRIIKRSEKTIGDTKKVMPSAERQLADTLRDLVIPAGVYFTPSIWAAFKLSKGFIGINPEIYVTVNVSGKIILLPLIYATINPQPKYEQAKFDTCRSVKKSESVNGNTCRRIAISNKVFGDTATNILRHEQARADTTKFITASQSSTGDTFKQITHSCTATGDTEKIIQRDERAVGDTKRIISLQQSISADTLRVLVIPAGAYFTPSVWAALKLAKGFIGLTPEIYATIIPYSASIVRISADTCRHITSPAHVNGDTWRKIGRANTVSGDTEKNIRRTEKTTADTLLGCVCANKIFGDTNINVVLFQRIHADTLKKILSNKIFIFSDTLRRITAKSQAIADTALTVKKAEKIVSDSLRKIRRQELISADTLLSLVERARADTLRIITKALKIVGDTARKVPHILKYVINDSAARLLKAPLRDATLSITNSFKDYGITSFAVTLNENSISDSFQINAVSNVDIEDAIQGRLLDYDFNLIVEEIEQQTGIQTITGKYDADKLLYSQIYTSGTFIISKGTASAEMLEILKGHIVKEEDDYFIYAAPTATDYIKNFAQYLGLTPNVRIEDFTPYNAGEDTNITYRDLLGAIFNWTTRLPQRQINVFIRGGTLHCIQRGMEESAFDISNLPHSRPTVNKKLIRTMWNKGTYNSNSNNNDNRDAATEDEIPPFEDYTEEEIAIPFNGTISFADNGGSATLRYKKGLLISENYTVKSSDVDSNNRTTYRYKEVFAEGTTQLAIFLHKLIGDFYLESKETTSTTYQHTDEGTKQIDINATTEYIYTGTSSEDIYLSEEYETNTRTEYELNDSGTWVLTDSSLTTRQTFHIPIGNGWYAQSVYVDGEPQGSNISQGKPGNAVSPYTINQVQKTFSGNTTIINYDNGNNKDSGSSSSSDSGSDDYEEWRKRLSPIADISFPVSELELLKTLTAALMWLNRKVQETIRVDLISRIENGIPDIKHIVDFTERVALNGKEYYLVSNQIQFSPRKLIQKLTLVRWYG